VSGALIICGPTSSGKSEIALAVARELDGEIVNADSRQIYRGMSIGTGSPPQSARERVAHHLYDFVAPAQRYSAARYVRDADAVIHQIESRGRLPIVVGGTGFYIEALAGMMPLDRPPGDDELRARLRDEALVHSTDVLWQWLAAIAPARAAQTKRGDSYRILRALEGVLSARIEPSDSGLSPRPLDLKCEIVVLRVARSVLRERIEQRVRGMFAHGLVAEAAAVRADASDAPALSGLGYAEALAYHDGRATHAEALASTIHRTRRYAKRQETWFRRIIRAHVVDAEDARAATRAIVALAREKLAPA
jgi:tRNA dimethylallyltransferase